MEVVMLSLPLLAGVVLVVWTHRLAERGRVAYAPLTLSAACAVAGVVVAATAGPGLEGLGEVLFGAYLIGVGGLTLLVCGILTWVRARGRGVAE